MENSLEDVPDEQVTLYVDKGLISQVFDNLFSNALKYTEMMEDQLGNQIKLVSCNRQILKDVFGDDIGGVRFNFFTTGKPLPANEARKVFEEGLPGVGPRRHRSRARDTAFILSAMWWRFMAVRWGVEPQPYGNLIYFILPVKDEETISP